MIIWQDYLTLSTITHKRIQIVIAKRINDHEISIRLDGLSIAYLASNHALDIIKSKLEHKYLEDYDRICDGFDKHCAKRG